MKRLTVLTLLTSMLLGIGVIVIDHGPGDDPACSSCV